MGRCSSTGQALKWPLGPLSGATSTSLHLQDACTGRGVCNRHHEAVGGGQQTTCLSRHCTTRAETALPSCNEEAETAPMLVRLGNGGNQAGKDCGLVNSGTRMIVPFPHASVTCRAVLGTQHRQGQGLLPIKDFDLPVPETCGSTGRIRQRSVVGDSLLWECRLLS